MMLPVLRGCYRRVLTCKGFGRWHTNIPALRLLHAEPQKHRSLVRVEGVEAAAFLQGLITNDMTHLEEGATSMYCMLLNTKGRVLYDTLVYRKDPDTFLLECDSSRTSQLERHLKMYRVRRKVKVEAVDHNYRVWCVFDPDPNLMEVTKVDLESLYLNPFKEPEVLLQQAKGSRHTLVTCDPRVKQLGHRLVVPAEKSSIRDLVPDVEEEEDGEKFRRLRYKLGVGEGPSELPPTKCLPLEANCDYLHGVSFHKGCYIGQELTARTFHTGVIRKRLLPLVFSQDASKLPFDASVTNEQGKVVGKVRGCQGHYGLGLLRIEECLGAKNLTVEGLTVQTFRPPWWPLQASKGKMNL